MASNSFNLKPVCFFILVSLVTNEAQDPFLFCSTDKTTANSTFQSNLNTLFSSLTSTGTTSNNNGFFNDTVSDGSGNPSDSVYGLFMCRGDVPSQLCGQCVGNATRKLSSDSDSGCSSSKQAVIWYDECMVRYSNTSFFSTVETSPTIAVSSLANISNPASFMPLLLDFMNQTADEATNSLTDDRYATNQTNLFGSLQTVYRLAQCTRDLSPQDCRSCLARAIENLPTCCKGSQGARVLLPSCNVRYELYPFYRVPTLLAGGLVPETKYPQKDSKYSDDPGYLLHNCSINYNGEFTTTDSAFQLNLRNLLSDLSSNATDGTKSFKQDNAGSVYGLFLCRDDIPPHLCGSCVENATQKLASECGSSWEGIIWYNHCFLRYSNQSFSSSVDTSPIFNTLNITNTSEVKGQYPYALSNALAEMANRTGDSVGRYQTESLKLNEDQTVYILAQCTPDLSSRDCGGCLIDVIGSAIPWSRLGSIGGRVLYPSCNLRFELFQFYDLQTPPMAASPNSPTETRKGRSQTIIWIVVPIVVLVILFSLGYYLIRRRVRKTYKTILRENFGQESNTLEPLQFDLPIIRAATNNFSHENKIGKGGFGEVYKGILIDGRHIAVKRLSRTSMQGAEEFKNEVLLIAKLQHRNLVALIGFCLADQEKMLLYEYVPNKSLNYFLFDTQKQKLLSWLERYKIIEGIARGILYLHEHSRLKIIHRDLKPSNILLDENMNPKISDFGLARIVEIDQDEVNTNKIVGTYGYMSPEYAMFGQFSEKSDVFSFGVMVLEIITGKKNIGSYESFHVADGLLSYVWRQWMEQTPLNIVDQKLKEVYSKTEVIKCVQMGLLCVQENPDARPTMVTIVSYLSSHSIELPSPEQPAFFLQGRMDQHLVAFESSSSQSANGSIQPSINRMSISEFHPR